MPKIRDHKRSGQKALVVSPWQSKKEGPARAAAATAADDSEPCMYAVVTSDSLLLNSTAASSSPATDDGAHHLHPAPTRPAPHTDSSSGWHTRPKHPSTAPPTPHAAETAGSVPAAAAAAAAAAMHRPLSHAAYSKRQRLDPTAAAAAAAAAAPAPGSSSSDMSADETQQDDANSDSDADQQQQQQQSQLHMSSPPSDDWLEPGTTAAAAAAAAAVEDIVSDPSSPLGGSTRSSTPVLQGVAQLVLHPSGSIFGHFVCTQPLTPQTALRQAQQHSSITNSSKAAVRQAPRSSAAQQFASSSSGGSSTRLCLGLQGRQVLGIHSCYRDPEWALLSLAIIRYGSSGNPTADAAATASAAAAVADAAAEAGVGAEGDLPSSTVPSITPVTPTAAAAAAAAGGGVAGSAAAQTAALRADPAASPAAPEEAVSWGNGSSSSSSSSSSSQAEAVAWVQRKGGDLVTLEPADLDDEDTETAIMAENLGELPPNVTVNFTAHTLLSGAAAAGVLARTWPELAGQDDVVVNLGEMSIAGLPGGFLQGS